MRTVYIVGGARTPIGSFQGSLAAVPASKLAAVAIKAVVKQTGIDPGAIDDAYVGSVLTGGQGQAPGRQAIIYAGLPNSIPCVTIGKVCGSGLRTVMFGASAIRAGDADVALAAGMENMSLTPYALPAARTGMRMGNSTAVDLMVNDGLWDVYNNFHMGMAAEKCAAEHNVTRKDQDDFAVKSYTKALNSIEAGLFKREIAAVEIPGRKGPTIVDTDEEPGKVNFEKIPTLKPAFKPDGTVTAANASSINDGAAAVLLASEDAVKKHNLKPRFRITHYNSFAHAPEWFTTAPANCIKRLWDRHGMTEKDIDVYEINEAFAVVGIVTNRMCGIPETKVNLRGGACALGHPIGASGTRILVTLMHVMEDAGAKRGLASLCIGGGEAVALVIERA